MQLVSLLVNNIIEFTAWYLNGQKIVPSHSEVWRKKTILFHCPTDNSSNTSGNATQKATQGMTTWNNFFCYASVAYQLRFNQDFHAPADPYISKISNLRKNVDKTMVFAENWKRTAYKLRNGSDMANFFTFVNNRDLALGVLSCHTGGSNACFVDGRATTSKSAWLGAVSQYVATTLTPVWCYDAKLEFSNNSAL